MHVVMQNREKFIKANSNLLYIVFNHIFTCPIL